MSLSRDDLRTRSEAVELSRGECGRGTARERREDGADDHTSARQTRSLCLKIAGEAGTVSTRHRRIRRLAGTWVPVPQ